MMRALSIRQPYAELMLEMWRLSVRSRSLGRVRSGNSPGWRGLGGLDRLERPAALAARR